MGEQHRWADHVRDIGERVQRIGWASTRLGHIFAERHALHPTDFRALTAIYRGELDGHPLTPRSLGEELDLSPAAATYAVGRLVASGHVLREPDPADGRRVVLRYAQPGLDVAARFFGPLSIAHSESLARFSPQELVIAAQVLGAIEQTLTGFEEELRSS